MFRLKPTCCAVSWGLLTFWRWSWTLVVRALWSRTSFGLQRTQRTPWCRTSANSGCLSTTSHLSSRDKADPTPGKGQNGKTTQTLTDERVQAFHSLREREKESWCFLLWKLVRQITIFRKFSVTILKIGRLVLPFWNFIKLWRHANTLTL